MTRRSISIRNFGATLGLALVLQPAAIASATEPETETAARPVRNSREILLSEDLAPKSEGSWLSPNFYLNRKSGIGYAVKLKLADTPVVLHVVGPVFRKQKALGLRFAINF